MELGGTVREAGGGPFDRVTPRQTTPPLDQKTSFRTGLAGGKDGGGATTGKHLFPPFPPPARQIREGLVTVRSIKGGRREWNGWCYATSAKKRGRAGSLATCCGCAPPFVICCFIFIIFLLRSPRSICGAYFYFPQLYFFAWCVPYFRFFPFAKLVRHARRRRKIEPGKINAKSDRWVLFYADRPSGDIFFLFQEEKIPDV